MSYVRDDCSSLYFSHHEVYFSHHEVWYSPDLVVKLILIIPCYTFNIQNITVDLSIYPHTQKRKFQGNPCCTVAKVLDCNIVVNGFKLKSSYYIHFQTNALRKGINPFIPRLSYGLNNTTTILLQGWLWH